MAILQGRERELMWRRIIPVGGGDQSVGDFNISSYLYGTDLEISHHQHWVYNKDICLVKPLEFMKFALEYS